MAAQLNHHPPSATVRATSSVASCLEPQAREDPASHRRHRSLHNLKDTHLTFKRLLASMLLQIHLSMRHLVVLALDISPHQVSTVRGAPSSNAADKGQWSR